MEKRLYGVGFLLTFLFVGLCSFAQDTPVVKQGVTKGELPFLEYGMGTDRLGGAKMTYLDTAVVLDIVDSVGTRYLVQLSRNNQAYIPKGFVSFTEKSGAPVHHLTKSWHVSGDDHFDYLRLALDTRLPYRSFQQIEPHRIIVDVFGAVNNTNWITQLKSVREIENVSHEQIEDDVFRVIIDLKHDQHWGYSVYYQGNTLVIKVKRQPDRFRIKDLKIAIDAGHGGTATGAVGSTGAQEKDYTLIFAQELEELLTRKGVETVMTRTEDVDVSMTERILHLEEEDPDLLISLHLNSSSNKSVGGTSTYYRYVGFRPLTTHVLDRMLDLDLKEFGNIGSFNFSLSGPTAYPNCLVEIAFISNEEDEKRILDPDFQKKVAQQIYKGIKDWLRQMN